MTRDIEGQVVTWLVGLTDKLHISLFRRSARLVAVTGYAGTDHIFPAVFTTLVSWQNVVYGKLMAYLGAILAGIAVAMKNTKAGQLFLITGTFNHMGKLDYGRYRKNIIG